MKKLFGLILLLGLFQNSFARNLVKGEARFLATDEDSLGFVKTQLKNIAFRDVITKELQSMGRTPDLFWEKFDLAFNEYFEKIDEKLRQRYKVGKEDQSKQEKEVYEKTLRVKRLNARNNYGNLSKIIISYSIKKMSRSPKYPKSRYMFLTAEVDRSALNEIYLKFAGTGGSRDIQKYYITSKINMLGSNWSKAGVDIGSEIVNVVNEHWSKWLGRDHKIPSSKIIYTQESLEKRLFDYMKSSDYRLDNFNSIGGAEDSGMFSGGRDLSLANSLWYQINFNIQPVGENELLKKRKFLVEGSMLVVDLKTNKVLLFDEIKEDEYSYNYEDSHKLSSNIATLIYRLPLSSFSKSIKSIKELPNGLKIRKIQVANSDRIDQLNELIEILSKKGIRLQIQASFDTYSKERSVLKVEFIGSDESFKQVLYSLQGMELESGKKIEFPNAENPFQFVLKDMVGASNAKGIANDDNQTESI